MNTLREGLRDWIFARFGYDWFFQLIMGRREKRKLTYAGFQALRRRFGTDRAAFAKHLHDQFHCRPVIDPNFTRLIKKLQADFGLHNFVETGTYQGETSLAMSLLFERVFTCDAADFPRRPELYLGDNVVYETRSSPDFLRLHLPEIRERSVFYLDAHWGPYWPLRDELKIIFAECNSPVVIIDDFDAGNGLGFDEYDAQRLDFGYVADTIPAGYKFCVNPWSNRNRGLLFLFPGSAPYGCLFSERSQYREKDHGLWDSKP